MKIVWSAVIALCVATTGVAGEFGCPRCASCGGRCVLRMRPATTTETCFDIVCEPVCIPAVRFPWECGPAEYGRTRLVTRLTTHEREAPTCEYEWVPVCARCGRAHRKVDPVAVPPAPAEPEEASIVPGAIWLSGR